MYFDPQFQPGTRLSNLAVQLLHSGLKDEAIAAAIGACSLDPGDSRVWSNLAGAYNQTPGRGAEPFQIWAAQKATELDSEDYVAWHNLSMGQARLYRFEKALESANRAHQINPSNPHHLLQAADVLVWMKRLEDANSLITGAVHLMMPLQDDPEIRPILRNAIVGRGINRLLLGDWSGYFEDYRARLQFGTSQPGNRVERFHNGTLWSPGSPVGRSVLIELEHGLGDEIHYCRLVSEFEQAHPTSLVHVRCNPNLAPLMLHELEDQRPYDTYIAGMDLVEWAYREGHQNPFGDWKGPYIKKPGQESRHKPGRTAIGFCWAGNPKHPYDWARSFDPHFILDWAEARRGTCDFYSCQLTPEPFPLPDWIENLACSDLEDTAAGIASLDVMVGPDTGLLHLAGAMGVPSVMLHPYLQDHRWRWPVYDPVTFCHIRQEKPGDWAGTFQKLSGEINRLNERVALREVMHA